MSGLFSGLLGTGDLEQELNKRQAERDQTRVGFDSDCEMAGDHTLESRIQYLMGRHGWQRPAAERVARYEESATSDRADQLLRDKPLWSRESATRIARKEIQAAHDKGAQFINGLAGDDKKYADGKTAYEQGRDANRDGQKRTSNPYSGSEGKLWEEGWLWYQTWGRARNV